MAEKACEEVSSAVLKKAQKSTKTTDDDDNENNEKHDGSNYKLEKNKYEEENSVEEVLDENISPIEYPLPVPMRESQSQICQRIIDQAFGKEELTEPILGEQYFSKTVNIEDTRQEIEKAEIAKLKFINEKNLDKPVPDDRVQFGVFQSRELSEQPLVNSDDLMMNDSMIKMSGNIGDINKDAEPVEDLRLEPMNIRLITAQGNSCDLTEKSDCIRQIESFELEGSELKAESEYVLNTAIAGSGPNKNENDCEDKNLPLNEILAQEEKFIREQELRDMSYAYDMHNLQPMQPMPHIQHMQPMQHMRHMQEIHDDMENMQEYSSVHVNSSKKSNQVGNAELDCYGMPEHERPHNSYVSKRGPVYVITNNEYKQDLNKVDANDASPLKADIASKESVEFCVHNQEKLESHLDSNIRIFGNMNLLNATTANENEEQLAAQKLEHIDETPLVEAHKPKLEGFNVTPRILGEAEADMKCTGNNNMDNQQFGASSKVDLPGSFDEVAKRCLDTPAGNIDEVLLREMEKLSIPITNNRNRTQLLDNDMVQMDVLKKHKKNPTETSDLDLESHDIERGAIELCSAQMMYPSRCKSNEKISPEQDTNDIVGLHPNQVLIDPYDKRTIAYDTDEYDPSANYDPDKRLSYYYVPHIAEDSATNPLDSPANEAKVPKGTRMPRLANVSIVREEEMIYKGKGNTSSSFGPPSLSVLKNLTNTKPGPNAEDSVQNSDQLHPHPEIKGSKNYDAARYRWLFNPFKINVPDKENTANAEQLDPRPQNIQNSQNAYASTLDRSILFKPFSKSESDNTELEHLPEIQRSHNNNDYITVGKTETEPLKLRAWEELEEIDVNSLEQHLKNVDAIKIDEEIAHSIANASSNEQHLKNVDATKIDEELAHSTANASSNLNSEDLDDRETPYSNKLALEETAVIEEQIFGTDDIQGEEVELDPQAEMDNNRFLNTTGIGKAPPVNSLEVNTLYDILDPDIEPLEKHPEINHMIYIYSAAVDKTSSLDPYNVNASCCTWGDEKLDPHPEINHLLYLHKVGLDNAYLYASMKTSPLTPDTIQSNPHEHGVGTNIKMSKSFDPSSLSNTFDENVYASKTEETLSFMNPKANVSDEPSDEYLDFQSPIKQEKRTEKVSVSTDFWAEDQLDPNYVLACNETCPIALKTHVCACETCRLPDTEAIFDKEFTKSESDAIGLMDYSNLINDLERGSHNDEPKQKSKILKMNKVANLFEPDPMYPSNCKIENLPPSINHTPPTLNAICLKAMPKLNEDVKLSELLRRVRERSRILEFIRKNDLKALEIEVDPIEMKCGRKAPRCPPTAPRSPPNNPVPPPSFGLPPLKPRPRACKPKRKPTNKCSSCDRDMWTPPGVIIQPIVNAQTPLASTEMVCEMNDAGTAGVLTATKSAADLTDDVIDRLQSLGKILGSVIRKGTTDVLEAGCVMKSHQLCKILLARDYQPWAPIPSWPTPKKDEPKKRECAPGCRLFPPPRLWKDPPCEQKPCTGFPRKTFSLLDCFAVSLGKNKMYDLGDF